VDPTVVRLVWVIAAFLTGFLPVLLLYFIFAFVIPEPDEGA
jgi:phage shock protein PspC (stress-responsive transcriptional regulator)